MSSPIWWLGEPSWSIAHVLNLTGMPSALMTFMSVGHPEGKPGCVSDTHRGGNIISLLSQSLHYQIQLKRKLAKQSVDLKDSNVTNRTTPMTYLFLYFLQLVALLSYVVQQLHGLIVLSWDLDACLLQASLQALQTHACKHKVQSTQSLV